MTDLAEMPRPTVDVLTVRRVRDGKEIDVSLTVQWEPGYAMLPARLSIGSGWVEGEGGGHSFAQWDWYAVEELAGDGRRRTFRLRRDPRKLLTLPPGGDRRPEYEVTIVPNGAGWCDCRGYTFGDDGDRVCKHVDALSHFVDSGVIGQPFAESFHEQGIPGGGREAEPGAVGEDRPAD
jgi:hypothetical protein